MNGMEVIPFRHSKSGVCAKVMWNFSTFEGPIMLASEECATGYSTEWIYCSCLLRAEDVSHLNDYPTIEEAGLNCAHFRHKKAKWTQLHGFIFITTQKLKCTKIQLPPMCKTKLTYPFSHQRQWKLVCHRTTWFFPTCIYLQGGLQD